jgi:protein-L-isoaspartate(D-aspartate) O-methyltransferase
MVRDQLVARGIEDPRVLAAMAAVPRHRFVDSTYAHLAYEDHPLPIAAEQTISQPYIVALMTELADVQPGDKVLEVGTGSGYQAAVLAAMGARVFSIEIVEELATQARESLKRLEYKVEVRAGDGYAGWPEHAPFDAILITAAPPQVPDPLPAQLAPAGKLVTPVGTDAQALWVWTKTDAGYDKRSVIPVRFVPMTGVAQRAKDSAAAPQRRATGSP